MYRTRYRHEECMSRKTAIVSPRKEKAQKAESARLARAIPHFQDHHPLARLYRAICYIDYAREAKQWYHVGFWANDFCSAYANLDESLKAWLSNDGLLPGEVPVAVGERSAFAWISYITALCLTPRRWERLREGVKERIIDGWGKEFLPTVLRPVSSWDYTEPPF
jgi:hypothetical protein